MRHGANFESETDVAYFEAGQEVKLGATQWSVSLWFAVPLPTVASCVTFLSFSNGDKIAAKRPSDEEGLYVPARSISLLDLSAHFGVTSTCHFAGGSWVFIKRTGTSSMSLPFSFPPAPSHTRKWCVPSNKKPC